MTARSSNGSRITQSSSIGTGISPVSIASYLEDHSLEITNESSDFADDVSSQATPINLRSLFFPSSRRLLQLGVAPSESFAKEPADDEISERKAAGCLPICLSEAGPCLKFVIVLSTSMLVGSLVLLAVLIGMKSAQGGVGGDNVNTSNSAAGRSDGRMSAPVSSPSAVPTFFSTRSSQPWQSLEDSPVPTPFSTKTTSIPTSAPKPTTSPSLLPTKYPSGWPTNSPTMLPSNTPSLIPRFDKFYGHFLSISGRKALDDVSSPQRRALEWLVKSDERQIELGDPNIFQRYSMAVLFYTFGGEEWWSSFNWMSSAHECNWNTVSDSLGPVDQTLYEAGNIVRGVKGCKDDEVTVIDLRGNNLNGTISSEIGQLTTLQHLFLSENQIFGTIPREIYALTNLQALELHSNSLEGSIPENVANLSNLKRLDLHGNLLTGPFPPHIRTLVGLTLLDLSQNTLMGTIPEQIGDLVNLESLLILNAGLTGTIPELGQLTNLVRLELARNTLNGTIPSELALLSSSLVHLDLFQNELVGTLPNSIGNLTNLEFLGVEENSLGGTIPPSVGAMSSLQLIFFHGNDFVGAVPSSLCKIPFVTLTADCRRSWLIRPQIQCSCCSKCYWG